MESATNDVSTKSLDPMVFYGRFQHISEKIFEKLDIQSLQNCRRVSKSWQECIDNQEILWIKFAQKQETSKNKLFQLACRRGHSKVAQVLVQNSTEFKIDINAKVWPGFTAFDHVCMRGYTKIAQWMIEKSVELNIDLNSKDKEGCTRFHLACGNGHTKIAEIFVQKSVEFNI